LPTKVPKNLFKPPKYLEDIKIKNATNRSVSMVTIYLKARIFCKNIERKISRRLHLVILKELSR
jgi:hypothetical protein